MSDYFYTLSTTLQRSFRDLYKTKIDPDSIIINNTKKEFEGDYTVVLFPYVKLLKINPVELGNSIGTYMVEKVEQIESYNVVKGFLNLSFSTSYWIDKIEAISQNRSFGLHTKHGGKVMVEFSSPNTNKPLHLGHIRNILLGWSCSKLYEAAGYDVIKTQIVNDRGIAVCKSMVAWQAFGDAKTPVNTGVKGDHFVGQYYVLFEKKFQEEYKAWEESEEAQSLIPEDVEDRDSFFKKYKNEYFNQYSELGKKAKDLLIAWEKGEESAVSLWKMMNQWVYGGFDETYQKLGVTFDHLYFESDTYLLGKSTIDKGLNKGLFYKEDDGSVWIDLEDAGYDKKILLRSDGTSVYMTQDIGTAMARYQDHKVERMIYVVADEQDYHFQVLFEILKRLGEPYADHLYHLSYGMVDLPEGKMKSREGTIVDADDLIAEVIDEARKSSLERGELSGLSQEQQDDILRKIGLAALKFFIIKVTPKKRMVFNPKESVDMQGQTGPYIQNAYVRIKSILRKMDESANAGYTAYNLHDDEKDLIKSIIEFPDLIKSAAENLNPSDLANYLYNLAKAFHKFYHDFRIMGAESDEARAFRTALIKVIAQVLERGFKLLGMEMPDRM